MADELSQATTHGTLVFTDESAALQWARQVAQSLLHALAASDVASDPIEAGYVHAKDMGTRARRQNIPWIGALIDCVADACFCEIMPLSGTLSVWLIGRRAGRATAMRLLGSLVPTAERLGQDAYMEEYHRQRKAGQVKAARGYKERWLGGFVERVANTLQACEAEAVSENKRAAATFEQARQNIDTYMSENFLPRRSDGKERARPRGRSRHTAPKHTLTHREEPAR
ncbi:MAG: DUF7168 domain-containing protein [Burkholderiales bacterium]